MALIAIAYLPAMQGGFVWDDDSYVTANPTLHGLRGLWRIWFEPGATPQYYPLTFTSFWLEVRIWGLEPRGFHVVNVALHAVVSLLLWRLLVHLELPFAWLGAALFAVHPVHVESVAWITERKNVLSGAFALGSALCFLRWADTGPGGSRRWWAASMGLFVAALLGKTATCVLPPALFLVRWWKRGAVPRREVLGLLPLLATGIVLALGTAWLERYHVGARGTEWPLTPPERVLVAGRALWFYASKLVWPHPLIFNYPAWRIDVSAWWQLVPPLAALGLAATLFLLRRRLGRGPLTATLLFAGGLVPVLGFIDFYPMRYSYVADHFNYLPSMSLLALAAAGVGTAARRSGPSGRRALLVGVAGVLCLLAIRTHHQSHAYRDLESLWRDTIAKNPASWLAHNNLGNLLSERGELDEALPHWREAVRIDPNRGEIHGNLGGAAMAQGRLEEAEAHYREALRLAPDSARERMNLGVVLVARGRPSEALPEYLESLRLAPGNPTVYNDLGVALAALGRDADAIEAYRAALGYDPGNVRALNNLGLALTSANRLDEAVEHYAEAIRLSPEMAEVRNNYAIALEQLGRTDEAIEHYQAVVRLAPSIPEAHFNLAGTLAKAGREDEAIAHYEEALRLRPDFEPARAALARLEAW